MSDATIKVGFRVVGEDAASGELDKVRQSVDKTAASLSGADKAAAGLGAGAKKLSPILGPLGGLVTQEFAKAGAAAGVLGNVLQSLPGPLGLIATGAVAAGAAIFAMTQVGAAAAKERLQNELDSLKAMQAQPDALARRYGVDVELVAIQAKQSANAQDLRAHLSAMATEEAAAKDAKIQGDEKLRVSAEQRLNTLRAELPALKDLVDETRKRLNLELMIEQTKFKFSSAVQDFEDNAAINLDKKEALEQRGLAQRQKLFELERELKRLRNVDVEGEQAVKDIEGQKVEIRRQLNLLRVQDIALAKEGEASTRRTVAVKKEIKQVAADSLDIARQMLQYDDAIAAIDRRSAAELAASEIALAQAKAGAAEDPAQRAMLEIRATEVELAQQLIDLEAKLGRESVQYANLRAAAETTAATKIAGSRKRADDAAKAASDKDRAAQETRENGYVSMANSGVQALEAMGVGERKLAGIKAAIAVAEGLLAFTRGDYAGAAAGAAAAVAFGAQAMGVGAYAATPGGGAGGPTTGGGGSTQGTDKAAAPITIVIQGGVYGTPQQFAQKVWDAQNKSKGTGLPGSGKV